MTYHQNNRIIDCGKYILTCNNISSTVVLVPEKSYIFAIKNTLIKQSKGTLELPEFYSIEGLDISNIEHSFSKEFISRNAVFAILSTLVQKIKKLSKQEVAPFVRAMIGELPNLYANKITPHNIINNIPSNISTHYEINLTLFVDIWKEFEVYLKKYGFLPYYTKQEALLEILLDYLKNSKKHLIILDDFGRSSILQHFIKRTKEVNINTALFAQNNIISNREIFSVQTPHSFEGKSVALTVKYLLHNNEETKIGIVCENEELKKLISFELDHEQIPHYADISNKAQSNVLIRFFLSCIEKSSIIEIVPMLSISNDQKKQILFSILQKKPCHIELWKEVISIFNHNTNTDPHHINTIFNFITTNKHNFFCSTKDFTEFMQFQSFLLKEIREIKEIGLNTTQYFILHVVNSWKVFSAKEKSSIHICLLRETCLYNFDCIILTSSYKTQPTGNVIFSSNMRKYYGFDSTDTSYTLLQNIGVPIFCTGEVIEFHGKPLVLSEKIVHENTLRCSPNLCITPSNTQRTINATDLEILFKNPLLFYYKTIKKLEPMPYILQEAMEVGNIVHKILEKATKKIQDGKEFDFKSFISQHFAQENLKHYISFYEDDLLKEFSLIRDSIKTEEISTETTFEYTLQVDGENFVLKSRADRINTITDTAIIYDYKTGSNTNFQNEIQNFEKIQLLIPALCLNAKYKAGKYKFIGLGEEIIQEITQDTLDSFVQKTTDILQKYFVLNQPFEIGKEFYSHTHVARI
jgi:hypothetical protein